jgi:hypothetical protein
MSSSSTQAPRQEPQGTMSAKPSELDENKELNVDLAKDEECVSSEQKETTGLQTGLLMSALCVSQHETLTCLILSESC